MDTVLAMLAEERDAALDAVEFAINSTVDIELSDYDTLRERIAALREAR